MAELTFSERQGLESLLQMTQGYVLHFSNRTLQQFVFESIGKDIYDGDYAENGESKANRLRTLFKHESNSVVAKILSDLLEIIHADSLDETRKQFYDQAKSCIARLQSGSSVPEIDALVPNSNDGSFEVLAREARLAIERDKPAVGLDRLHTYMVKYTRELCDRHGITHTKDDALNGLFGQYVKVLDSKGHIKSELTKLLLKSSISTFDRLNGVRNNESLAHANELLNYEESILIFNQVTSVVRFVSFIEKEIAQSQSTPIPQTAIPVYVQSIDPAECPYCILEMFPGQQCPHCGTLNQ